MIFHGTTRGVDGRAGSGKSLSEGAVAAIEWLSDGQGIMYTTIPLFLDEIAKYTKKPLDFVQSKIHVVPMDNIKSWMRQESGPWDYFADKDIVGSHIICDEIHKICSTTSTKQYLKQWSDWLGELRHEKARFTALSQNYVKIAKKIRDEMEVSVSITHMRNLLVPYIRIPFYDLWMFCHCFYIPWRQSSMRVTKVYQNGKMVEVERRVFTFDPDLFKLYDSYAAPLGTESGRDSSDSELLDSQDDQPTGVKHKQLEEWERYSRPVLFFRVLFRNYYQLWFLIIIIGFIIFILSGGFANIFNGIMATTTGALTPTATNNLSRTSSDSKTITSSTNIHQTLHNPVSSNFNPNSNSDSNTVMQQKIIDQQRIIKKLNDKLQEKHDLIAIIGNKAVFRNGQTAVSGDYILYGEHSKKQIINIDSRLRYVLLDDDTTIWLIGMQQ